MKRRDIVIGVVVLAVVAGVIFLRSKRTVTPELQVPSKPQTLSIQSNIEQKFNVKIPDNVNKAELSDVTGGASSGLATENFQNKVYELSILADLPDPASGKFYEVWISKGTEGQSDYQILSAGKMQVAKGGWLLDYKTSTDYSQYKGVIVSLQTTGQKNLGDKVLQGSFQ